MASGAGVDRVERLLKLVEENADALEALVRLAAKLRDSGLLAVLEAVAETGAEGFIAATRLELVSVLANLMAAAYAAGRLDPRVAMDAAENLPPCVAKAYDELSKPPGKPSLAELLRLLRSPETLALLRALHSLVSCLASSREGVGRPSGPRSHEPKA